MSNKDPQPVQQTNQAALRPYRRAGLVLIPLRGKKPRHRDWPRRRYDTKTVIANALASGDNVGARIAPGWVVFDIDPRNGGDDSFERLCLDFGFDDAAFPTVRTGSGGLHVFARVPVGAKFVGKLAGYPGVDVLGVGRQVVAAGSTHPDSGRKYHWIKDRPALSDAPAIPAALLEAIQRPDRASAGAEGGELTAEQVAAMLSVFDPTDYRNHDDWLRLMMAVHHASNGDARPEFIDWSIGDPNYSDQSEVIGARWDSLHRERNDGVTVATLFSELAKHGRADLIPANDPMGEFDAVNDADDDDDDDDWLENGSKDDEGDGVTDLVPIETAGIVLRKNNEAPDDFRNAISAVERSGLEPRFNMLTQKTEFCGDRPWDAKFGRELTDDTVRHARLFLMQKFQGVRYQPSRENVFEALQTTALRFPFNPVLDYLDTLTWDGVPRIESLFATYFGCRDDTYTRAVSRCFLIGAVRRQRQPGVKFDTMPVIKGPQGVGKSSGLRALFGDAWFSDGELGNLRDKDSALNIRGKWCQEFAEIESLTRAGAGDLKAFVSRAVDRVRAPYDRTVQDIKRRCVFVATVNEGGYLRDPTGGRRFWPLTARGRIDVAAIVRDRDQVWAEAAMMEARRDALTLPESLWPDAAKRQAAETSDEPWADSIRAFLEQRERYATLPREPDDEPARPVDKVHTVELLEALGLRPESMTRGNAARIRTIMEAMLGWRHRPSMRIGRVNLAGYVRTA